MNQMHIVIVNPPGRKRDSLLTLLESMDLQKSIVAVETCSDAMRSLDTQSSSTILIDYRNADAQLDKEIGGLIMNHLVNHIVLLQARNAPKSHFTHYTTSEVVFDDLSVGMLKNLLKNITLRTT